MRRTNLVLDEALLEQARQALGERTYSSTVNFALAELLRLRRIQHLEGFYGSQAWHGNLNEMREDRPAHTSGKRGRRRSGR